MHSSSGCIVSAAIDYNLIYLGYVCQTLKLQLARCDLLELDEKKVRLLIIMMCDAEST